MRLLLVLSLLLAVSCEPSKGAPQVMALGGFGPGPTTRGGWNPFDSWTRPGGKKPDNFAFRVVPDSSGPSQLSTTMTNGSGTELELVLACHGGQESGSSWTCTGDTLSESGGSIATTTETMWTDAATVPAVDFDATTARYAASSSSVANMTTQDFVVELVARMGDGAADLALCKIDAGDTIGWRVTHGSSGIYTFRMGASGGVANPTSPTGVPNTWNHFLGFGKRNDASGARSCLNGECGTAASTTAFGTNSMSNANTLGVGACGSPSLSGDQQIAAFNVWRCPSGTPGCLVTANYAALAMERSAAVDGVLADLALGSRVPTTKTATSIGSCAQLRNGKIKLYPAGNNALCVGTVPVPATGAARTGLNVTRTVLNRLLQSQDFSNASWTKTNTTVSGTPIADPFIDATGDTGRGIIGSAALGAHYVSQSPTAGATQHGLSVFAKAGAGTGNKAVMLYEAVGGRGACFKLSDCTKIADYTVAPTTTWANAESNWTYEGDWCRFSMTWTATAVATEVRIYASDDADSCGATDYEYTGDGSTVDVYLFGAQLEHLDNHGWPGDYVPTTTAVVQRGALSLKYSATSNVPSIGVRTMRAVMFSPDIKGLTSGGGQLGIEIAQDVNNYLECRNTSSSAIPGNLWFGVVTGGASVLGLATSPTGYMSPHVDMQNGNENRFACTFDTDAFFKIANRTKNDNGTTTGSVPPSTSINFGFNVSSGNSPGTWLTEGAVVIGEAR